jgi:anti-sigma B factor antagonist
MQLSIKRDDGQTVEVAVVGQVTQREISPLRDPLVELLGPHAYERQVRLDLRETTYMDSSGVGWLLLCHKRMRQAGGKLVLVDPHPVVASVLRILKLDRVLAIETSAPL